MANAYQQKYYPYVMNVHKLFTFISLNDQLNEILACPQCGMPEWSPSPTMNGLYKCHCCDRYTMRSYMNSYSREEYLSLLESLPLKYDGAFYCPAKDMNNKWTRTYADLSALEVAELDNFAC